MVIPISHTTTVLVTPTIARAKAPIYLVTDTPAILKIVIAKTPKTTKASSKPDEPS